MRRYAIGLTILVASALLATACTRDRPAAEPVTLPTEAPIEPAGGAGNEPNVVEVTPLSQTEGADAEETPEPDEEEVQTFQHIVAEGDSLLSLALQYGTDVATLQALNNLFSDNIAIGQPLRVPYSEQDLLDLTQEEPASEEFTYTVKQGDTLGAIGLLFGVSTIDIIEANNLLDYDSLIVGTQLTIPGYSPEADVTGGSAAAGATAGQPASHVVQIGETLTAIAAIYSIDPNTLAQYNNISNWNVLRVGQELLLPGLTAEDVYTLRGQTHIVQSGETISLIAEIWGVTPEAIITFNGIDDANSIYVGQSLIIPE